MFSVTDKGVIEGGVLRLGADAGPLLASCCLYIDGIASGYYDVSYLLNWGIFSPTNWPFYIGCYDPDTPLFTILFNREVYFGVSFRFTILPGAPVDIDVEGELLYSHIL
jgi:hypothetical protein